MLRRWDEFPIGVLRANGKVVDGGDCAKVMITSMTLNKRSTMEHRSNVDGCLCGCLG